MLKLNLKNIKGDILFRFSIFQAQLWINHFLMIEETIKECNGANEDFQGTNGRINFREGYGL